MARDLGMALSWPRAIVATVVVVALGVALATVWFFGMLAAFAWLLRRLQARRLI